MKDKMNILPKPISASKLKIRVIKEQRANSCSYTKGGGQSVYSGTTQTLGGSSCNNCFKPHIRAIMNI